MRLMHYSAIAARRTLFMLAAIGLWNWLAADWFARVYVDSRVFMQDLSLQELAAHPVLIPTLLAALILPASLSFAAAHPHLVIAALCCSKRPPETIMAN